MKTINKITKWLDWVTGTHPYRRQLKDPNLHAFLDIAHNHITLTPLYSHTGHLPYIYAEPPDWDRDYRPGAVVTLVLSYHDSQGLHNTPLGLKLQAAFFNRFRPTWETTINQDLQAWAPYPLNWPAIAHAAQQAQETMTTIMNQAADAKAVLDALDKMSNAHPI